MMNKGLFHLMMFSILHSDTSNFQETCNAGWFKIPQMKFTFTCTSIQFLISISMESTLRLSNLKSGLFFKNIETYWRSCNSSPTMTRTTQRLTELFLLLLQNQENARLSSSRQLDHKQWMEEEVKTVHVFFLLRVC